MTYNERNPTGAPDCTGCGIPFVNNNEVYPGTGMFDALCKECWLTAVENLPDIPDPPEPGDIPGVD